MKKFIFPTLLAFTVATTAHADDDLSSLNELVCEVVQETTTHALKLHHAGRTTDDITYHLRDVSVKVLAELLKAETDDDVKVAQFITSSVAFTRMSPIVAEIGELPVGKTTNNKTFLKKTHANCLSQEKKLPDEITFIMESFESIRNQ